MEDMSRSNGFSTYRSNNRMDDMPERPSSDALVDLHVYLVPHNLWRERYNNFLNANVTETVSAGIIRVHPEQKVILLRNEIDKQIGAELVPREYVFLKSVGRSITKLNGNQEYQLKVKNFIPPQSYAPELFLLEAQDVDSSRSSVRPESPEYATGRKSDRTPYTSHNTNPTSPEYNVSSAEKSSNRPVAAGNKYDSRLETYTNHTNEDSGIAGLTPEDHYRENQDDDLDRRKRENEEKRRREAELRDRLKADQEEREQKEKSGRDKEWERHEQLEEERRRKDEEEKRGREGEKRRQEEADKRRENEEEARREQDRNLDRLSASDEELNRFPSPPPLKMSTPSSSKGPRDSIGGSDTERGQHGKTEKEQLMRELEQAREARKTTEKQREDLVKKAKMLQNKMQNRRNHARDLWKKRYFEEKKRTSPLEEQCNRLRHELEIIHRKLMNTLEGPAKDKATQRVGDLKPSLQSNYKIQAARLMHEIEDIRRRLENAKMKLTAEMKLRNQAETELRAMRAELIQKKINRTLTRHSHYQPSISASDPYLNQTAVSPRS
ncbi:spermatogenesis-associated protein 1-like isoform X3 [Mizuhopecten yessoensis]|uniref:spermatogenesis-associated protein 1-like isoform X3 n=1 Tax=Mizuhopecten yessoensis TaxID=6573 RepID=UPI000B457AED|nr:spermatogenesis-associated protein 1-like isoform X3 [Mizuhopecten yessoensis]